MLVNGSLEPKKTPQTILGDLLSTPKSKRNILLKTSPREAKQDKIKTERLTK